MSSEVLFAQARSPSTDAHQAPRPTQWPFPTTLQTLLTCLKKQPKTGKLVILATSSNLSVLESLEMLEGFNVSFNVSAPTPPRWPDGDLHSFAARRGRQRLWQHMWMCQISYAHPSAGTQLTCTKFGMTSRAEGRLLVFTWNFLPCCAPAAGPDVIEGAGADRVAQAGREADRVRCALPEHGGEQYGIQQSAVIAARSSVGGTCAQTKIRSDALHFPVTKICLQKYREASRSRQCCTMQVSKGIPIKKLLLVAELSMDAERTLDPARFTTTMHSAGLL